MNFHEAINQCKEGAFIRRTDWGYSTNAYLAVHEHMTVKHIYIYNSCDSSNQNFEGYGVTLTDIDSINWEIVQPINK